MKECQKKLTAITLSLLGLLPGTTGFTKDSKFLSTHEVKSLLPCALPLISKRVDEVGFAKELKTIYGDFEFLRTDIGVPDGLLTISKNSKKICVIDLSLNPEIYFSGTEQIMVLSSYSGSNEWYDFYKLKDGKCDLVGSTHHQKDYALAKSLIISQDGKRRCGNSGH